MQTINKLIPGARGLAAPLLRRATTLALDWDTRQKSRFDATDSAGRRLAVFLPRGTVVRGGDVLVVEDGTLVRVEAAPQAVMVVRPCAERGQPGDLMRAAYHLGNRHVAVELHPDRLLFEPDHVLADMLRGLHLVVSEESGAFEPEGGAYPTGGHGHGHGHAHAHEHEHEHEHEHGQVHVHGHADGQVDAQPHEQGHGHAHAPAPVAATARGKPLGVAVKAAAAPHVHGPGCGHGHDHGPHEH